MRILIIFLLILSTSVSGFAWGEGKYFKKGVEAMDKGDLEAAKVFFNEAINKNPKFSRGYSYLALTQQKMGDIEGAITNYKLAYKFDDKDFSSLTNLCGLYLNQGKLLEAHESCTKALSINAASHVALNQRCLVFLEQGRYESAIADCSQAIQFKDDYTTAYINRGMAYTALQQYENAADDFSAALKTNPTDAKAYNNRCNAYKELKRYEEAIADCSKALVLDGNVSEAYLNRGAIYEMVGKADEAVMDYRNYLKHNPDAESVRQRMNRLLKDN